MSDNCSTRVFLSLTILKKEYDNKADEKWLQINETISMTKRDMYNVHRINDLYRPNQITWKIINIKDNPKTIQQTISINNRVSYPSVSCFMTTIFPNHSTILLSSIFPVEETQRAVYKHCIAK